ncbi:bifunctional metallophosphatase/5'-nucleotidase [Vibrio crassostreae]|uniref:bifunctional metallophosphatase/5'-nucleotidase n=1 Tax=Vibrio crassostreae TaxID=246167 RepID=UPI0010533859|nr:bifunctional UDP-sugar hydrolase/5'-nucleotidase [Vibrio crassostreae]TCN96255.1 5'-nucleotidase [Vibrio crassostreae]CAK1760753.1 5'-nucleotidase [Vibrio crassostreae]CAK1786815.1 5'-nucleotidase [Vibrio crassostreae]CAK2158269.1 5'-nucleotidase [Vibrio crassostreae]CAK2556878.1 5'-nucleotidase [Vibrio crassostreae]
MTKKNKPTKIVLAHINDTHSYFEPTSLQLSLKMNNHIIEPYVSAGGFARISTRFKQIEQDAQRQKVGTLFLHAGDCFQGTLYFSLFKGKANADLLNALNIDAMTLGNHELDMGNEPVAIFAKRIKFPLLAGNWNLSNEDISKTHTLADNDIVKPYITETQSASYIKKEFDGEKVAIFGLSIDKMSGIANPDIDTPFENALETAKATIKQIHQAGINKIVLLSHLGYEADLELAANVSGIGVIVGGHSHRLQGDFSDIGLVKDDDYGVKVGDTYVVQAGFHAMSLGHCEIEFDSQGKVTHFNGKNELLLGRRLFIDAKLSEVGQDDAHDMACEFLNNHPNIAVCKKDPELHSILTDKYQPRVRKLQQQVIAHADSKLRHVRIPDEQGPSQLAPLVAQSFHYLMNKKGHVVEFAIHNSGGVRNSLNSGDVSVADIAGKLLPFAVPIGVYEVRGETIAGMLEGAINNALDNGVVGTGSGSFPYTHNLRFCYHKEAPLGHRIHNLEIHSEDAGWQSVSRERVYRGASSAYTMKGKEGYNAVLDMIGDGTVTTDSMADCFIEFLQDYPESLQLNEPLNCMECFR